MRAVGRLAEAQNLALAGGSGRVVGDVRGGVVTALVVPVVDDRLPDDVDVGVARDVHRAVRRVQGAEEVELGAVLGHGDRRGGPGRRVDRVATVPRVGRVADDVGIDLDGDAVAVDGEARAVLEDEGDVVHRLRLVDDDAVAPGAGLDPVDAGRQRRVDGERRPAAAGVDAGLVGAGHLAARAAVGGAAGERRLLEAGRADRRLGDAGADARVVRGRVGDPAHLVRAPGGGVAGLVDRALGGGVRVGAGPAAAVAEVVDRVGALRQDAVLPVVGVNGGITRLRVAEDDQAALG